MGIGFVLVIWAVVGTIVAGLGAVVFGTAASLATLEVRRGRRTAILAASAFPFVCLSWAGGIFIFQAAVNQLILHRDPGIGDSWQCPLPNGYAILMIDETDQGMVYNPKTQTIGGGGVAIGDHDQDAVSGVRKLQISGKYILGGADSKAFDPPHGARDRVDGYFLLDSKARTRADFPTYASLSDAVLPLGIKPNLEPIETVYGHYRYTRFDILVGILVVVPPLLGAVMLFRWIQRLRNTPRFS